MKTGIFAALAGVAVLAISAAVLIAKPAKQDDVIKDPSKAPAKAKDNGEPVSPLDFKLKTIDGKEMDLAQYKGKAVLLVNVASRCGLTKQYAALQGLHEKYKDKGLVIVGIPANNFGGQEPGTEAEIKEFCTTNYKVTLYLLVQNCLICASVPGSCPPKLLAGKPRITRPLFWYFL